MKILLEGREIAKTVISINNLLPRLYPEKRDSAAASWKAIDSAEIPSIDKAVENLRKGALTVSADKVESIIRVGINMHDPFLACKIVEFYLDALNMKIQNDVREESEVNRQYLTSQLMNTSDPIIKEKIQGMIAFEIEKSMLVAYQSFDILEKPYTPMARIKPNRRMMVAVAMCAGVLVLFAWTFFRACFKRLKEEGHG